MDKKTNRSLWQVKIIYILSTIFLVVLSVYGYLQTNQLLVSQKWVNHTHEVVLALKKISSAFNDVTSNQKGYLLTGDSTMLSNRDEDFNTIIHELNLVDSLTKDNPEQIENLKILRTAINEKLADLKLKEFKPIQADTVLKLLVLDGFNKSQNISEQINRMSLAEEQLLESRTQKFTLLAFITPLFIIILFLSALTILWISYSKINKDLHVSQQLQSKVQEANRELEKKNEELIKGGEQYFKIFDNNPVAMAFAEIGTNHIIYANKLFYKLFGYTAEEVIGRTSDDLNIVSQEEKERTQSILLKELQEERTIDELQALPEEELIELLVNLREKLFENGFEVIYTRKNGSTFYAIVFYEIIEIGSKKYALASYQDITELKRSQFKLAEQRAFAESVIDNDPAMVLAYDENLKIIAWNKKTEENTGFKKEEVMGKNPFDIFPEYRNEKWESAFNSVLKEGKKIHYPKVPFKRMKGFGEFWLVPLLNADQHIIGILSITRDITETTEMTIALEQKNIELEKINKELLQTSATLETSQERYHRMIVEVKDYAVLFLSKEGIIEHWNEGAERIKGYKAEEIIGNNFNLFYTEQDRQNNLPEKLLTEAKQKGTALHEGWRIRKNGSKFWGSTVITALHDSKNTIIGFSKVTRDLTDKKIAEDRIVEANKALEQKNIDLQKINKELESINYISSHDLQEPLRQIQIFGSRISDADLQHLSDSGKTYFQKIKNAARRMQNLINDLLAYSRIKTEARKFKIINLNEIINELIWEFAEIISDKQANIEVAELGDAKVIPIQFRQMMHNLIGNALKFSKPDTPPHITINNKKVKSNQVPGADSTAETEYYHISISDNGIGFDTQYKDRIFEVFQRLHDKQKIEGTGIGLAIVKNIVENHNGFITATSELNMGATFDIYIPTIQNHTEHE